MTSPETLTDLLVNLDDEVGEGLDDRAEKIRRLVLLPDRQRRDDRVRQLLVEQLDNTAHACKIFMYTIMKGR